MDTFFDISKVQLVSDRLSSIYCFFVMLMTVSWSLTRDAAKKLAPDFYVRTQGRAPEFLRWLGQFLFCSKRYHNKIRCLLLLSRIILEKDRYFIIVCSIQLARVTQLHQSFNRSNQSVNQSNPIQSNPPNFHCQAWSEWI